MGLRITTWNVNGIRNPFGYQPWRDKKTFAAMFDVLEADIVIFQETKIQRKDLQDDMVLVPGWDVYFSLPKHKKGYSGVVIYTRSSVCAPIRAEEGITGILCPPMSTTSFMDQPEEKQIGGYPSVSQYSDTTLDAATLDSEGRCVILEFPAFVLIGTYCPATRDESRDEFRIGFLNMLDARIRNLTAMGKRVILAGDINIVRDEIDTAGLQERLRKEGMTVEEFFSMPSRRFFNQLLEGGRVHGERDEGREKPVMVDICREFHPDRKGMYTCWETKKNLRPANFGSRIDYICVSTTCKDWFSDSNIQEGLMGSDHCPVYADIKDKVLLDDREVDIRDVMNPPGMFEGGVRRREWTVKDLLPISAKLIPEFDRRQSIRDMFKKKPSLPKRDSSLVARDGSNKDTESQVETSKPLIHGRDPETGSPTKSSPQNLQNQKGIATKATKRSAEQPAVQRQAKKSKVVSTKAGKGNPPKGQSSLHGFFKVKPTAKDTGTSSSFFAPSTGNNAEQLYASESNAMPGLKTDSSDQRPLEESKAAVRISDNEGSEPFFNKDEEKNVIDPIVTKESWGKLLGQRVAPRCEHNEPCISLLTKKQGVNCGRSFYICPRPLGPTGEKERGTEWRCGTFIWSSDWKGPS